MARRLGRSCSPPARPPTRGVFGPQDGAATPSPHFVLGKGHSFKNPSHINHNLPHVISDLMNHAMDDAGKAKDSKLYKRAKDNLEQHKHGKVSEEQLDFKKAKDEKVVLNFEKSQDEKELGRQVIMGNYRAWYIDKKAAEAESAESVVEERNESQEGECQECHRRR